MSSSPKKDVVANSGKPQGGIMAKKSGKTLDSSTPNSKQFFQEYEQVVQKNLQTDWLQSNELYYAPKKAQGMPEPKQSNKSQIPSFWKKVETTLPNSNSGAQQDEREKKDQILIVQSDYDPKDCDILYAERLKSARTSFLQIKKMNQEKVQMKQTKTQMENSLQNLAQLNPNAETILNNAISVVELDKVPDAIKYAIPNSKPAFIQQPVIKVEFPKPSTSENKQNSQNSPGARLQQSIGETSQKNMQINIANPGPPSLNDNNKPSAFSGSQVGTQIGVNLNKLNPSNSNVSQSGGTAFGHHSVANSFNSQNKAFNNGNIPFNNNNNTPSSNSFFNNNKSNSVFNSNNPNNYNTSHKNNALFSNQPVLTNAFANSPANNPQNSPFNNIPLVNSTIIPHNGNQSATTFPPNFQNPTIKKDQISCMVTYQSNPSWISHRNGLRQTLINKQNVDDTMIDILAVMTYSEDYKFQSSQIEGNLQQICYLGLNFVQCKENENQLVKQGSQIAGEDRKMIGMHLEDYLNINRQLKPRHLGQYSESQFNQIIKDPKVQKCYNKYINTPVVTFLKEYIKNYNYFAKKFEQISLRTLKVADKRKRIQELFASIEMERRNSKFDHILGMLDRIHDKQENILNLLYQIAERMNVNEEDLPKNQLNFQLQDLKKLEDEEEHLAKELQLWSDQLEENKNGVPYKEVTNLLCECTSYLTDRVGNIEKEIISTFGEQQLLEQQ